VDRRRRDWLGWLAVLAVAAMPVIEAVRIVVDGGHVVLFGDQALLELGARRAAQFDQLVGPYSREGFHHPGPAVFYLLAPFVRVLEPGGPGLYLGAIVISGSALVATVAFLWRRAGAGVALWAAAATDVFCLCLPVGTVREPWNPYLVITPMVLYTVLWAAAITGVRGAAIWSLVVGSYEIQTHIATAGLMVVTSATLLVWMALAARRRDAAWLASPRHGGPASTAGALALAFIWVAPVVELWRDHPNNVQQLWAFFTAAHPAPSVGHALNVGATAMTILPFGNRDYVQTLSRTPTELVIGATLLVSALAIAVVVGRRRRQPLALALAASSLLGAVVGTLSLTRATGPLYLYLAAWLAFVPVTALLAVGVALLAAAPVAEPTGPPAATSRACASPAVATRRLVAVCAALAVVAAALVVHSDLTMGPVRTTTVGGGPWPNASPAGRAEARLDVISLVNATESVLQPGDRRVAFTIGTAGLWPYLAGIVLELDERGIQSTVGPASWTLYFGHERAPGPAVSIRFNLYAGENAATTSAAGIVIADAHGAVLTYQRVTG
jgi:hypothetical protein